MYLSRIRLNPTRRQTWRALASPQIMHASVMGSVPPTDEDNTTARTLWRLDQNATHEIELYVVTTTRPDFTGIIEQMGWPTAATWQTADYTPFLQLLRSGQEWRFRLTANPIHRVMVEGQPRARVVPHRTAQHQQAWLLAQSAKHGFECAVGASGEPDVLVRGRNLARFDRRSQDDRQRVEITRVTFDGRLVVTDAEQLQLSLRQGIGRAKGYGCGLLTLAPLP